MNVLLISVDSLRADYTDFPTMLQLRKEGVFFDTCISPAPCTPASHASQFTGLQPYAHGIKHLMKEKLRGDVVTLPQVLRRAGYATGGFVSAVPMSRYFGLDRGFDLYDDDVGKERIYAGRTYASRRAEQTNQAAIRWLRKICDLRKPFFLFIHYFDVHWPYEPTKGFEVHDERYSGEASGYASEVSYADHHMGGIIKVLKDLDSYEDTLFIVTSDHGEDLGEHGGEGSPHPEEFCHGWLVYDATQKVPLIFRLPKSFRDAYPQYRLEDMGIPNQVRLIDIMPTVLDVLDLGQDIPARIEGVSLVPFMKGETERKLVALCQNFYPMEAVEEIQKVKKEGLFNLEAIRWDNKWKHIYSIDEQGNPVKGVRELYDLVNDPKEQVNLLD